MPCFVTPISGPAIHLSGTTLGIFAKQPVPGQVKTRLCPPLMPEDACRLYRVSLEETISRLSRLALATVLCQTGSAAWFHRHYPDQLLLDQGDGDLGQRLQQVSTALFAAGGGPVLLVGSDSPDLPLSLVEEATAVLAKADLVTIPCRDGGYALIGLRHPCRGVFDNIPWSTAEVLRATRQRAKTLQLAYREVGTWEDFDDLPSLQRLAARSPDSATAVFIRTELAHLLLKSVNSG